MCQFHQHFTHAFCANIFVPKIFKPKTQLCHFLGRNFGPKHTCKMLLKLTPGVNFINILHTNFSYKRRFGCFFYVHVTKEKLLKQRLYKKIVRRMLMKLTSDEFCGRIPGNVWQPFKQAHLIIIASNSI